ncbi:helix-turn-helix domain-containing protein [Streptomyces sp. J2-1]|uniref:helix-turn-helix transcriptional regulator n=1 Tax=Streptomyces corallincola TaxID=2851888 RepID=UPI001C38E48E|nr:helix-turn-helix transcriptional regulator [Streptomyces corallincola]MBV2356416.1 helix-turn-helix domain-containing protein [Streptomyces corallincola]
MSDEEGAERAGPGRPVPEEHVAARIKLEREVRGWSTVKLAEEMATAGHPINQSAIWRIESGKPRRRVNLDEALGFCKVFDITMHDLTGPPGELATPRVRQLAREYVEMTREYHQLRAAIDRNQMHLSEIDRELNAYADKGPERRGQVDELLRLEERALMRRMHPSRAHHRNQGQPPAGE